MLQTAPLGVLEAKHNFCFSAVINHLQKFISAISTIIKEIHVLDTLFKKCLMRMW